jgi:hypothetical protein
MSDGSNVDAYAQVQEQDAAKVQQEDQKPDSLDTDPQRQNDANNHAKNLTREQNRKETTCDLVINGDTNFHAGLTMQVSGYGKFSATYLIDSVQFKLGRRGFTTAIKAHKCLPSGSFTTLTAAQIKAQAQANANAGLSSRAAAVAQSGQGYSDSWAVSGNQPTAAQADSPNYGG